MALRWLSIRLRRLFSSGATARPGGRVAEYTRLNGPDTDTGEHLASTRNVYALRRVVQP